MAFPNITPRQRVLSLESRRPTETKLTETKPIEIRRYDLDWLRIIAFGLLIFYHIGMFYVTWGWHVKSVHAGPTLEPLMRVLNPWRLPLLFFISGVALRFAFDKAGEGAKNKTGFTLKRTARLLLPIMFGIHVIVAPQSWLQLLETEEISRGFWAFYPEYLIGSSQYSVTIPTWNHLWYVVYLMLYTLILAPFAGVIARIMRQSGERATERLFTGRYGIVLALLLPAIPHLLYRACLDQNFPTIHDVVNDWANHAHSFTYLLTGFILAKDRAFWGAISRGRRVFITVAFALGVTLSITWYHWDTVSGNPVALWTARFARVIYTWSVIAALLALAQKYLNRPSPTLTYMTEAIFPWYILHQTVIVMAGYWLTRQSLSFSTEFIALVIATFGGCLILHEVCIRRFKAVRPLFGLRFK